MVARVVWDHEAAGSSPVTSTTSEQSPLCSDVFFCLRHKKPPGASLPCSSSPQKVTLRLRCSLVNALTTLRLATNFFRKRASLFKTLHPIRDYRLCGGRELFCPRRHSIYFVAPTHVVAKFALRPRLFLPAAQKAAGCVASLLLLPAKSLVCSGCSLASAVATPPLHYQLFAEKGLSF